MAIRTNARLAMDLGGMWQHRLNPDQVGTDQAWYTPMRIERAGKR